MFLSRRSFVKAASVSGLGALTVPLIAARGSEALRDGIFEIEPVGASGTARFASDERAAFRIALPDAIRLDSNENPNGPGQTALEAIRAMFGEASRYPDVPTDDLKQALLGVWSLVFIWCLKFGVWCFSPPVFLRLPRPSVL